MNLAIVDTRLHKVVPVEEPFLKVYTVDGNTLLKDVMTKVIVELRMFYSTLETLRIQSHGANGQMQFCEGLRGINAYLEMGRLKEWFDPYGLIVLQGCNIVSYGSHDKWREASSPLMTLMASATNAYVMASADTEYYGPGNVSFGAWEGRLHLCAPSGKWYQLGNARKRRDLTYPQFVREIADYIPERTLWRVWGAMFPDGRSRAPY